MPLGSCLGSPIKRALRMEDEVFHCNANMILANLTGFSLISI